MSVWVHITNKDDKMIDYINTDNVLCAERTKDNEIRVVFTNKVVRYYSISLEQFRDAVKGAE